MTLRPIAARLASEGCTDHEIDAALALLGEAPLSAGEIALAQQTRHAARTALREALAESAAPHPLADRLRDVAQATLVAWRAAIAADDPDTARTWAQSWRAVAPYTGLTAADRDRALGREALQHLGYTAAGYDTALHRTAEDAEVMAAAEREEERRRAVRDAH